jgi:iron(III) transport system substrate-binding protein
MTDHDDTTDGRTDSNRLSRRRLLAGASLAGATALAGCNFLGGNGGDGGDGSDGGDGGDGGSTGGGGSNTGASLSAFQGSGPLVEARDVPGGTRIADLPDLSGTLNLYLGGGEGGLYIGLIDLFRQIYPDFSVNRRVDASSSLVNTIITEVEAGASPADVFIAVDAGSLAAVAQAGAAETLSSSVTDPVASQFHTDQWAGFAGRARAIPYNTNQLSASEIPDTVQEFPSFGPFADAMGWAPTYSAFQSFVTAMRLLRGEDGARSWLNAMQDHGITEFNNEFVVSNAVANGELAGGFANHYYALRVQNARPNAPVDLAFTSGDAGALVNVSGGLAVQGTEKKELVENFMRHLLSAEAQEFFATRTFAYPTVPEVPPAGGLPTIDELSPPDIDLTELGDQQATLDLLRDTGVL